MKVNQDKFKELILYLSEKSRDDKKFGATKLNKLLYFCDFGAYVELGKPITSAGYFRLRNGPAPRCLLPVRKEMVESGLLEVQTVHLATKNKPQERTVNLRAPKMNAFSPAEMKLIDSVLMEFRDYDSDEISDRSHREMGWLLMAEHETIPYPMAFYSNPPLTEEEIARGRQIAASRRTA
jgi:uncharacterized phage-associated protein